jgi:hypothetical protein
MRVAYWRDGGEPRPTRIAIIAPCHRLQRAGINTCTVVANRKHASDFSPQLARQIQPVAIFPRVVGAGFSLSIPLSP